jgi:hypothetical protein
MTHGKGGLVGCPYTAAHQNLRTISGGAGEGVHGWHLEMEKRGAYVAGVEPIEDGRIAAAYLRSVADPGEEVRLEVVGSEVPPTRSRPPIAPHAQNLDFSELG